MLLTAPSARTASAVVFFSAAVWGTYWIPLRYLEEQGLAGTSAVALLALPAILPLLMLVLLRWRDHRGYMRTALAIGFFTGMGIALYSSGVLFSSVVRATLLFYLTPAWATLIEVFWLKERAGWLRWLAIIGGFTGMSLLLSGHGSVQLNIGDLLALLSGIFWAIGSAMIKRYDRVPLPGITLCQFSFTALGAILIGYMAQPGSLLTLEQSLPLLPVSTLVSVGMLLPTLFAIFWAQKFIYPGRASLLMMSEVLIAVLSASLLLPEERMTLMEWCGALLIVTACLAEVITSNESTTVTGQPLDNQAPS
ncbi:DMT family transporter [Marinobacterium jannaschii]|uniref:DMT family transporter n=1 Tax=Marinobacterium jannaschii TaxID=64970 RepID=UPI0006840795|nr:EamA family transporter [Marinobacterium jannaschii]